MSEIITRYQYFKGFVDTIGADVDYIGFENDPVYKPGIEKTYLRVFLGSTFSNTLSIGGGCFERITECESTIEIVTPSKGGINPALIIEEQIICAARRWGVRGKMRIGNNAVSSDPSFMEKLTRCSLPVKVKYTIITEDECNGI